MNENNQQVERTIPFLQIIYKNLVLIILLAVLGAGAGLGYAYLKVKPVYTAKTSIMLKMSVEESNTSTSSNNATLAKKYLQTVEACIKSKKTVDHVKENTGLTVNSGSIGVSYGTKSMIFSVSYSSYDKTTLEEKLKAIISSATSVLATDKYIMAESIELIPVQNKVEITEKSGFTTPIISGFGIGLVVALAIAFTVYLLDNTVKDKDEIEELTGVSVLALIENK